MTSYMSEAYLSSRPRKYAIWDFDDRRVAWSHEYIGTNPRTIPHERPIKLVPLTLGLDT